MSGRDGEQRQQQESHLRRRRRQQQQRRRYQDEILRKAGYCDLYVPCPRAAPRPPRASPRNSGGTPPAGRGGERNAGTYLSSVSDAFSLSLSLEEPSPPAPISLLVSSLLDRFRATNVTTIALTHTVHGGAPNPSTDAVDQVFPSHWIREWEQRYQKGGGSTTSKRSLRILTRLHAVVESASDLRHYQQQPQQNVLGGNNSTNNNSSISAVTTLLRGYDVVSISPRNDAVFQAACEVPVGAALFDIITLEYFSSSLGGRAILPFRIRAGLLKSAARNGLALEVPYAPALLNGSAEASTYRRAFVQTLHELKSAALGVHNLCILVSSGPRGTTRNSTFMTASAGREDNAATTSDAGPLAIRMPDDIRNLLTTVLGWDHRTAVASVSAHPQQVVHGRLCRHRRFGSSMATRIRSIRAEELGLGSGTTSTATSADVDSNPTTQRETRRKAKTTARVESSAVAKKKIRVEPAALPSHGGSNREDDEPNDVVEDGFISLN